MRAECLLLTLSLGLLAGGAAFAQSGPPPGGVPGSPQALAQLARILKQPKPIVTINRPQAKTTGKLTVTSATLGASGIFPVINTGYGKSISPQVSWTAGPTGTASYMLIMEDGTAGRNREGVLHWLMFNLPPGTTSLAEGAAPPPPTRMGANMEGKTVYSGSHAPVGGPPFHYHIQVFALDRMLDLPVGASRHDVWAAIDGHVLAAGEVIGEFQGPSVAAYQAAQGH